MSGRVTTLAFDEHGEASLDGRWDFFPDDLQLSDLDHHAAETIEVPGLWEAQGWLGLDGYAWYRRSFHVDAADADGFFTLRFGAVMDVAEVWCNGVLLGGHDNPFTPFDLDATGPVRAGENVVAVRVFDPPVDHPDHLRLAHGKQGWANHVFPSRPSLYMTYGGIWQPVVLRRHGPVVLDDLWVNGDPDDLRVEVTARNVSGAPLEAKVWVRALHASTEVPVDLPAGGSATTTMTVESTSAARWSPASPSLHVALAEVSITETGAMSDHRGARFGLRTIRLEGNRFLIDGEPYRMKSALVQGFRADGLYAEGSRAAIEEEVRTAASMGFNTLRLHIKAFDPTYLDVCDEVGMLLHCDIPVAEPIAHEELGGRDESDIGRRSFEAVQQQIRRDRNHPSIILWSVMNELCLDRIEARAWDGYERFARSLVAAAKEVDDTRPVIENDWVEPDPDRVFAGDVLTAHWYGRLHTEYLAKIEASCNRWAGVDRPLFVSEFGDWGLPEMPSLAEPPFWDTRGIYATGLVATRWPGTISRFVSETQRYQGLSDRLQAEVFRRHDHIAGYCLTELTDVPHELNGVLDLHRQPKRIAVQELRRANQVVLPMLRLDSLVVTTGADVVAPLTASNDGPALEDVEVEVRFGDAPPPVGFDDLLTLDGSELDAGRAAARFDESVWAVRAPALPGHRPTELGRVVVVAPNVPGSHDLVLRLRDGAGRVTAENRYTLHVVRPPHAPVAVRLAAPSDELRSGLGLVGASVAGDAVVTIVPERGLDAAVSGDIRARLAAGEVVIVLAQPTSAAEDYPFDASLFAVETAWGSSVFHFTTDHGALPSLPRRNVLVAEDSTIQAHSVVTGIDGGAFPEVPVVIAFKPVPGAMTGTIVGSHPVGPGRLVFCQYRLCTAAAGGDAAALALLADLLRWAGAPRRQLVVDTAALADGRRVARYAHQPVVAR